VVLLVMGRGQETHRGPSRDPGLPLKRKTRC
jgi:hypothetical protein